MTAAQASAVRAAYAAVQRGRRSREPSRLSLATRAYLVAVAAAAVGAMIPAFTLSDTQGDWMALLLLGTSAAVASLFVVPTGRNHGFHMAIAFIVAAILLLPPGLVGLVAVVQHVPDWLKRRYPWYIQLFNVSNYTVDALAAWAVAHVVLTTSLGDPSLRLALAGLGASLTFVLVNHVLLAGVLLLARDVSIRDSLLLSGHSLWIDLGLAALGVGVAGFWHANPYLVPVIVATLILVRRSFTLLALLRQSEERFRAIFESTALGIKLTSLDGRLVQANHALEELLGYGREQLAGSTLADLTHEDDLRDDHRLLAEMVSGARESYQEERRLLRRDRSEISANVTSSVVRDADGKPIFAIGMVQDVTRRKQLEEQLRHAQKMEAIGRLAGSIAHDFNNVLTVIETYSGFALAGLSESNDEVRKDVEEIKKAGQQASSLTRQLLAFSRRQVLQPHVLDLNEIVADTEKMLRRLIGGRIDVVTSLDETLGAVRADANEIVQVLINLAVNARDAMPAGGTLTLETANVQLERPEVGAGVEVPPGSYVLLTVRDTGTGIDPAIQSRIFEPFFTTKERGKGTGFGLSTVYGTVAQSGGYVFLSSRPGEGAAFTIYLPRVTADEPSSVESAPTGEARANSGTVLLVEDEDRVRDAIRRILGDTGYTVLEAFDGNEGLRIADRYEGRIDLLVTDVVMPMLSGPELAGRLAVLRPETKVLFVSGYTAENDVSESLAAKGVDFLQKPFTEEALREKVRSLLDGGPATRTAAADEG